jgi:uncharacterized protein YhfF
MSCLSSPAPLTPTPSCQPQDDLSGVQRLTGPRFRVAEPPYRGRVDLDDLPLMELGFPGPLRDQLVGAVLDGSKTTTTGLVVDWERDGELPAAGQRYAVIDTDGRRVAAIELTEVRVLRLADVDLQHVIDEGEGDESIAAWRVGHEGFWHGEEMRAELGDPEFTVDDDTLVLAERFRVLHVVADPE